MNKIRFLALSLVALAASAASIDAPDAGVGKLGKKPVLRGHEVKNHRQLKNARLLKKGNPNGGGDDTGDTEDTTCGDQLGAECCRKGNKYYCNAGFACSPHTELCVAPTPGGDGVVVGDSVQEEKCYDGNPCTAAVIGEFGAYNQTTCESSPTNGQWGTCIPVCTKNTPSSDAQFECTGFCIDDPTCCAIDDNNDNYSDAVYCF